jgi:hypothetical protein
MHCNLIFQRSGFDFADDIISLTFSYLDINGAPTSTKALIWQIAVEMIVTSEDAGIFQIKTRIFPRQFFDTYGGFQ